MPLSDDVLIRCENVSKRFCRDLKTSLYYGIGDILADMTRPFALPPRTSADVKLRKSEFWANKDISFEVRRGECLGLIGRNGAGKTTLLKILSGLIRPDTGHISMDGTIGSLIALGAGFNPLLTGRENIFVNGSVLGVPRKSIHKKFDEIVEFAELEEFIDTPVRNYSSGMQVRLGFAVATLLIRPDILILDEVLAVGDIGFRAKCYQVVSDLRANSAVLFVSHNLSHIERITQKALFMKSGVGKVTSTYSAIESYIDDTLSNPQGAGKVFEDGASVQDFQISAPGEIVMAGKISFATRLLIKRKVRRIEVSLNITTYAGDTVARCLLEANVPENGELDLVYSTHSLPLSPGEYNVAMTIDDLEEQRLIFWQQNLSEFKVTGKRIVRPGMSLLGEWHENKIGLSNE